jgi:hypothetical protein
LKQHDDDQLHQTPRQRSAAIKKYANHQLQQTKSQLSATKQHGNYQLQQT